MYQRAPLPPSSTERTLGVGGAWSVGDVGALPNAYAEAKGRGRPKSQSALSDTERSRLRRARLATRTEMDISGAPENISPLAQVVPVESAKPLSTAKGISGAQNRYVSVTRTETAKIGQKHASVQSSIQCFAPASTCTETLKNERKPAILDLSCPICMDVFCDWITLYQDHAQELPVINDGFVVRFEPDAFRKSIDPETGELRPMFDALKAEYTVSRKMEYEGSFETKVSIRCDGRRVELSGNVGRFGRPDNLFGLPVLETIERANEILAAIGLPPFTGVDRATPYARTDSFSKGQNAVITRVDLTANFATGSREAAFRCLHWMSGQGTARNSGKNPRNYGNGVTWNEGSKRHYEKLYFKADELGPHVSDGFKANLAPDSSVKQLAPTTRHRNRKKIQSRAS